MKNIESIVKLGKIIDGTPIKLTSLEEYEFLSSVIHLFNNAKLLLSLASFSTLQDEMMDTISEKGYVFIRFNLINMISIVPDEKIANHYTIRDVVDMEKRDRLVNILKTHIKTSKGINSLTKKSLKSGDPFAMSMRQSVRERMAHSTSIMHMAVEALTFRKKKSHVYKYRDAFNIYQHINRVDLSITLQH